MLFNTHNNKEIDTSGTKLVGSLQGTTRTELLVSFGKPIDRHGDKTNWEWQILFPCGTVATVYDWKRDATGLWDFAGVWHVGGKSIEALHKVNETLDYERRVAKDASNWASKPNIVGQGAKEKPAAGDRSIQDAQYNGWWSQGGKK